MTLALLGFLATVNPAAAAMALTRDDRHADRPVPVTLGAVGALVLLVALAAAADPLLDGLDVNLGTYRLGAGAVVAVAGLRWLVAGAVRPAEEPASDRGLAGFVTFPVLLTPGAAALAVSVGAEHGVVATAGAAAVGVLAGGLALYLRRSAPPWAVGGLVRFLGAVAAVVGVIVAIDGIRTL